MKTRITLLALMAMLMAGIASAASVNITMQNWAGNSTSFMFNVDRNAPVASVTGTADAAGLGAGYTLEITATSTWDGTAARLGETNGGFTVPEAGSVNRLKDGSIIYFDMKIKNASDVDVTANYYFTITDLEAMVSGNQTAMSILVDGTTSYEFHKGTGDARIWASNTSVPSYDVPDPSSVSFAPLGNPAAGYKFNFTGMKLTVDDTPTVPPGTLIFVE
jgi:hypothetical protein